MEGALREYACAYCGERNETMVDPSAGARQSYVEDCAVCCHPNVLSVSVDQISGEVTLQAESEE